MQHYLLITVLYYTNNKILATYLKVLMERSWAQKFKHQTIVTLKAENILKVQNKYFCTFNELHVHQCTLPQNKGKRNLSIIFL